MTPRFGGGTRRAAVVLAALLAAGAIGYTGVVLGRYYERNWHCCKVPTFRRIIVSVRDLSGLGGMTSDRGQDRWVMEAVFPGVVNGYFVDVGSADGFDLSNTASLERLGWNGVCIDAFPRNMERRRCQVFQAAVDREAGRRVRFFQSGDLGGIADYLGHTRSYVEQSPAIELVTTTLGDILARANAPAFIHFMSIDIEGAEYAALQGFPFDRYRVGAFVIEHNFQEPKRGNVQQLLAGHGYRISHSFGADDFYIAR